MRQDDSWPMLDRESPVGLFATDARGVVHSANQRWAALCGVSVSEAIGDSWLAAVHADDRERVVARWNDAVRSGTSFGEEFRLLHANGDVIWVLGQTQPVVDQTGAVTGHAGSLTDITAWRQEDDALRESEARFRALAAATAAAIWTIDAMGEVLDSPRERWPHLTDLPADELAEEWLAAVHPDDRETGNRRWWEGIASGRPFRFTQRVRQRDGSFRHFVVRAAPVRSPDGAIREWVGADIEITNQKRAEHALAESERRFRALAQAAPSITWTAAPDGTITYVNDRWLAYTGISAEENATGWLGLVLHPDDEERCLRAWRLALATGEDYEIEVRNRRHDGEYRWFLTRAVPARDDAGNVTGWYGSTTDIHDARRIQDHLAQTTERFQRAESASSSFSYELDVATGRVERSAGLRDVLGYAPEEIGPTWQAWRAVIHPEDTAVSQADAIRQHAEGRIPGYEYRARHKDGSYRWLFERETVIRAADGTPQRIIGHAIDVTSRKLAEDRLRISEQRLRAMADAMPQVVWIADAKGTVNYYNSRVAEFSASVNVGHGVWDWRPVIHPDDLEATSTAWRLALQHRSFYAHEHRIQMADGAYRWHLSRAHPVLDRSGEVETWYGTATDIHDLKQAEIALQENQARLQVGIDVAGFGLAEFDRTSGIGHFSAEAASLFALGEDAVSVPLSRVLAIVHPEDQDAFSRRIHSAAPAPQDDPHPLECRVVLPTGEVRWLSVRARVLDDVAESLRHAAVVMAVLDVTERKRAEADQQALLDAIAHDLRNPLTTWKFRLQLLRRQMTRDAVSPERLVDQLIGFERLADQMTDLLEELEELAEVSTRPVDMSSWEAIDLVALLRDGIAGMESGGAAPPVVLVSDSPEIPCAWARTQVQRVVASLLRYAVNCAPAGGFVSVRLARTGRTATIDLCEEWPQADDDLSAPPAMPVSGTRMAGSSERGGGLATVKTIVERHGGSLAVANAQSPGVMVRVLLPLGGPAFATAEG